MSIDIGRLKRIYLGIEATPGTAVVASVKLPVVDCTIQDKHEPIPVTDTIGHRADQRGSVIGKRWSEGDINAYLDAVNAGHLLKLACGNEINTNVSGTVYDHNFYVTASGNQPLTATVFNARGSADVQRSTFVSVNELTIDFEDNLVNLAASCLGQVPTDQTEPSVAVVSGSYFSFRDVGIHFGSTVATADVAAATPVNSFNCTISNNIELIWRSGQGDVQAIRTKEVGISGGYTLFFEDKVQRDYYRSLTKRSLVAKFTGMSLGSGYSEQVKIRIARMRLDEAEVASALADFYAITGSFVGELDLAQSPNLFDIVMRNNKSATY